MCHEYFFACKFDRTFLGQKIFQTLFGVHSCQNAILNLTSILADVLKKGCCPMGMNTHQAEGPYSLIIIVVVYPSHYFPEVHIIEKDRHLHETHCSVLPLDPKQQDPLPIAIDKNWRWCSQSLLPLWLAGDTLWWTHMALYLQGGSWTCCKEDWHWWTGMCGPLCWPDAGEERNAHLLNPTILSLQSFNSMSHETT